MPKNIDYMLCEMVGAFLDLSDLASGLPNAIIQAGQVGLCCMDKLTREQRRKNMQSVKSKDSLMELRLRKTLWHRGYRYRKNYSKLEGKPDIVLVKYKVVIFCDSEFWHGFDWRNKKNEIKSNQEFWIPKIERNIERDAEVNNILRSQNWTVLRFWGNEIKNNLDDCICLIENTIKGKLAYKDVVNNEKI